MSFLPTTIIGRAIVLVLAVLISFAGFRLWLSAHDAAVLKGYVLLSEKTAAEAKANEMERQRNKATQIIEEYRKRERADEQNTEADRKRMEEAIANDRGDGAVWSDADRRWLCDNGIASACVR